MKAQHGNRQIAELDVLLEDRNKLCEDKRRTLVEDKNAQYTTQFPEPFANFTDNRNSRPRSNTGWKLSLRTDSLMRKYEDQFEHLENFPAVRDL